MNYNMDDLVLEVHMTLYNLICFCFIFNHHHPAHLSLAFFLKSHITIDLSKTFFLHVVAYFQIIYQLFNWNGHKRHNIKNIKYTNVDRNKQKNESKDLIST